MCNFYSKYLHTLRLYNQNYGSLTTCIMFNRIEVRIFKTDTFDLQSTETLNTTVYQTAPLAKLFMKCSVLGKHVEKNENGVLCLYNSSF